MTIKIEMQSRRTDYSSWNDLLERSRIDIYNIYQTCEWAELQRDAYGYSPIYLIARDGQDICGSQLYLGKKELGYFYSYKSLGGPLGLHARPKLVEESFINHMRSNARSAIYLRIRPGIFPGLNGRFIDQGFVRQPVNFILVDIGRKKELIWQGLKKNARRGIEKASKSGISIIEAESWIQWMDFYKIHIDHSKRKGFPAQNLAFFQGLYRQFLPKGMARLFIALFNDVLVAGALFLCYKGVMSYHIGASDDSYIRLAPNDLIFWQAIMWGNWNGFSILDLDDTWPDQNSPHYGIHKFKEKWGGELIEGSIYLHGGAYILGRNLVKKSRQLRDKFSIRKQ
ncbi:MAG: peptidoglycan bridge formation glycyltransferase FemA/FemB family protein [Methanotrichaceae archaeon]|nr:peptidoglycan bridge formation glycyltransferase FemA/FemB family protein [Methanotrichaceae archaeon]